MDLSQKQKIYFRDQFREARAAALRDAEGYQQLLFVLERLGYFSTQDAKAVGLNSYKTALELIAEPSLLAQKVPHHWRDWHTPFSDLFRIVKDARNDALHQGAFARHLTTHAMQLALVLEDGLMNNLTTVSDYMVRDPSSAFSWQPISFVRQQMLINAFSYLPILLEHHSTPGWYFISDTNLARCLRVGSNERDRRLVKSVREAIDEEKLQVDLAHTCYTNTSIGEALQVFEEQPLKGQPLLVVKDDQQDALVGILTAFDLM